MILGAPWGALGVLGRARGGLGRSMGDLRGHRGILGGSQRGFWGVLGVPLGGLWGSMGGPWGPWGGLRGPWGSRGGPQRSLGAPWALWKTLKKTKVFVVFPAYGVIFWMILGALGRARGSSGDPWVPFRCFLELGFDS